MKLSFSRRWSSWYSASLCSSQTMCFSRRGTRMNGMMLLLQHLSRRNRFGLAKPAPIIRHIWDPKKCRRLGCLMQMKYLPCCWRDNLVETFHCVKGSEDCLQGLDFVITGVLDSITREDAEDLIKRHGGSVKTGVSKKTSYVLTGVEPGESKTKKVSVSFILST